MAENKPTATNKPNSFNLLEFINSNTQIVLVFLLALISFVVFKDFIFFKKVYLFKDIGSDSLNMYMPWFNSYADYVKTEGTPGWSFQQGMGQNVFPLWLGDFFSNIMMYFDKSHIPYALAYMEIAKIMLSGFVFYRFLKELKLSNYVSLVFALLYAFSGFMIMGGSWVIYSIEALDIAVILYGFERWLNHKKIFWFVTGITLLTFLQPALLLPYTIFLATYIVARFFDVNEKGGKDFFIFTFKTIGLAVLGVAISAYQLLPDILQIIESPRVGGDSAFFETLKNQSKFTLADEWIRHTTVFRSFATDLLGNGTNFKGYQNYLEAPIFYCGLLCLVLLPQFFVTLTKRQKRIYGAITFLFVLPIFFPYFRYMFWAFSGDYYRTFSLVIVLFIIIYSARALNYIEEKQKINKVALLVTVLFLLFLLYTPTARFKSGINESMRSVITVFLLGYGFFVFRMGDAKALKNNLKTIFLFVCVIELMYNSYVTVNDRITLSKTEIVSKVGFNDYTVEAAKYLKDTDKSFYRVNKDYQSSPAQHVSLNEAKVQGYYGTSSYHSFNQKNYIKFLADFGVVNPSNEMETRWAKGLIERPILFSLVAGKYWFTRRTDNSIKSMGFDSITSFADVKIFKNKFAAPFGVTYDKTISEENLKKLSNLQKDFAVLRACVIPKNDEAAFAGFKQFNLADTNAVLSYDNLAAYINALRKDSLTITKFSENNIVGNINVNEPKILFLAFPLDDGWKAKVNNAETKLYAINAGLTGLILSKGANTVELSFEPRLRKKGGLISIASMLVLAGMVGFARFRKKP